jgi:protein-disulfide isomerase
MPRRLVIIAATIAGVATLVLTASRFNPALMRGTARQITGGLRSDIYGFAVEPVLAAMFICLIVAHQRRLLAVLSVLQVAVVTATGASAPRQFGSSLLWITTAAASAVILAAAVRVAAEENRPHLPQRRHRLRAARLTAVLLTAGCAALASGGLGHEHSSQTGGAGSDSVSTIDWWKKESGRLSPFVQAGNELVVTVYSDYECFACAYAHGQLRAALASAAAAGLKVRVVERAFPLSTACNRIAPVDLHPAACEAAVAVNIVPPNMRPALVEWLYANQGDLSATTIRDAAVRLGRIEPTAYESLRPAAATLVREEVETAIRAGVRSTPTFVINGVVMRGSLDAAELLEIVSYELSRMARGPANGASSEALR